MAGHLNVPFEILSTMQNRTRRTCYSCRQSYPGAIRFCPQDGVDLEYGPPPIDDLGRDLARPPKKWTGFYILAVLALTFSIFLISDKFFHFSSGPAASGELILTTTPTGAIVYLDGSQVGVTPVRLSKVPVGIHEVKAIFPGYENGRAHIEILPSTRLRVVWDLAPLPEMPRGRYLAEFLRRPSREANVSS